MNLMPIYMDAMGARQTRYEQRHAHLRVFKTKDRWPRLTFWERCIHDVRAGKIFAGKKRLTSIRDYIELFTSRSITLLHMPRNVGTFNALSEVIAFRVGYEWDFWNRYVRVDFRDGTHGTRLRQSTGSSKCLVACHDTLTVIRRWEAVRAAQLTARREAEKPIRKSLTEARRSARQLGKAVRAIENTLKGNHETT